MTIASFGSNYNIFLRELNHYSGVTNLIKNLNEVEKVHTNAISQHPSITEEDAYTIISLGIDDSADVSLEQYCKNNNIKFTKKAH